MIFLLVCLFGVCFQEILGEGLMYDPPGRSSVWRYNSSFPANYDDNRVNCGGYATQFNINEGRCGVCGDRYDAAHPQANENTGKYGRGKVVQTYNAGSTIDVHINITANEKGGYNFSLCVLTDPSQPESGEDCFTDLKFEDGSDEYTVEDSDMLVHNRIVLPPVACDRCVLRWTYRAGNNWGICPDGSSRLGCGPQDHFRSCADIAIKS